MQRKNELSFLNIIFCLLVIFIHVSSAPVTGLSKESWQYAAIFIPWRLSAFVVQGFIFLSGLKMYLKEDTKSYPAFLKNKFTKIICPYIFAVIIFYAYFLSRNYFGFSFKDLFGYIMKGDLVSHFYFVIVIVQFYLLKPVWSFLVNKTSPKITVIASIIVMFVCKYAFWEFQYNDRIFTTYLAYWVMGCYAGRCYESLLLHIRNYKMIYISQFIIVAAVEAMVSYREFVYGGMILLEELHFIYCVSAIFAVLSIATLIADIAMSKKLFKKIDNASYYIYLSHPIFIFITNEILRAYMINDLATGFVIRFIITYLFSILLWRDKRNLRGTKNVRI